MRRNDCVSVIVHDFAVVGPISAANLSLAKGLASERARQVLEDPTSEYYLSKICDCNDEMAVDEPSPEVVVDATERKLDDETAEGFAALAKLAVTEVEGDIDGVPITDEEHEEEEAIPFPDAEKDDINGKLETLQDGLAVMQCEIV